MKGLELTGMEQNRTVRRRIKRGEGENNPYGSKSFLNANRIVLDATYLFDSPGKGAIKKGDLEALIPEIMKADRMLKDNQGDIFDNGIPMTGWLDLPVTIPVEHIKEIISVTKELGRETDAFVSLGIGGSYLGIEATFRALTHTFFNRLSRDERGGAPEIYFLGNNLDPDCFRDTLDMLEEKRVAVNVISKSGTTTETAVAFRIIEKLLEESWPDKAQDLILVTTDKEKGALRSLAGKKGYRTFVVPDDIGGRFSVLSDVGLVGLAMANIDIEEFIAGFARMREIALNDDFWKNPCLVHAAARHAAWTKGKKIEVVATNSVHLYPVARWMEQLFPESEGHEGHGMWVAPALYSEKLHANGQMVQDGERNIFETFLYLKEHENGIDIPATADDLDGLNFLPEKGIDMNFLNRKVIKGPAYAHYKGGVPNITIEIPRRNAFNLGQLYYMMERSVAVSGYLMGHNPFVQPGVEAYKKAMFAMIGKPGYEEIAQDMKEDIKEIEKVRV